ncbi:MAG: GTP-binding protein [Dehalococcoidia bacterium]|nr:GTP-binding protein [Dehalococcoidia bacterium]
MPRRPDIRNIAIIAHVDHGKTTPRRSAPPSQSSIFRENQKQAGLRSSWTPTIWKREKGITIMAKNAAIRLRTDVHASISSIPPATPTSAARSSAC